MVAMVSTQKKKNRKMKGLPVVKQTQPGVPQHQILMNIFGLFKVQYQTMLWAFWLGAAVPGMHLLWEVSHDEDFGKNFTFMTTVLVYVYTLDAFTKLILHLFTEQKAAHLRLSALTDDTIMVLYGLMIPQVYNDHWKHFIAIAFRDVVMAASADLWRIYAWPDNEHNRKRVMNFQSIIDQEGIYGWALMLKTPMVRALTEHFALKYFLDNNTWTWSWATVAFFPVKVIVYETVNDFFYYWFHRVLHIYPWIYKQVHKLHHASKCPTALNASTMTVSETFLTFALTDWWTMSLMQNILPMTLMEFIVFSSWIVSIEVYGHSGHILELDEPSVWRLGMSGLLCTCGIRLDTKDHELHHWNNIVNYGKRLQLWDKMFGTYDWDNMEMAVTASLEPLKGKKKA